MATITAVKSFIVQAPGRKSKKRNNEMTFGVFDIQICKYLSFFGQRDEHFL
jgi:hypothetical protein